MNRIEDIRLFHFTGSVSKIAEWGLLDGAWHYASHTQIDSRDQGHFLRHPMQLSEPQHHKVRTTAQRKAHASTLAIPRQEQTKSRNCRQGIQLHKEWHNQDITVHSYISFPAPN